MAITPPAAHQIWIEEMSEDRAAKAISKLRKGREKKPVADKKSLVRSVIDQIMSPGVAPFPLSPKADKAVREETEQEAVKTERKTGMPMRSLVQHESGNYPFAVSRAGAKGPAQFMPETAEQVLGTDSPKAVYDPSVAIPGGAAYLNRLKRRYDGNIKLALAAYNWGPANLDKAIARYGNNPDRILRKGRAPKETINYVNRVMGGK